MVFIIKLAFVIKHTNISLNIRRNVKSPHSLPLLLYHNLALIMAPYGLYAWDIRSTVS